MALALRERGNAAFLLAQFATAEAFYSQALLLEPTASLLANRAAARAGQQHWELALQDAVAAAELDPGHAKAWFRLAEAAGALGQHAEAVTALEKALVVAPLNKQLEAALAAALAKEAASPSGWADAQARGDSALSDGNSDAAAEWYSHALSFDPPASAAAALLGSRADCRRQQGQLKAALADADAVLVLEPTPAALLQRALLLEATERYDAAAEAFAAALAASGTAEALAGVRRMRGMR